MRMSLASTFTSTSSASGSTATVMAEVWTRPCVSVAGTRCTRCTPLSYFIFELGTAALEAGQLLLRHGGQLGVALGQHAGSVGNSLIHLLELAVFAHNGFEVAVGFGGLVVFLLVRHQLRVGQLEAEVFITRFNL